LIQRTEREEWFLSKIGSVLFRNDDGCPCPVCKAVYDNGVRVDNRNIAIYLYDIECSYNADGDPLRYFDTIEERDDYEHLYLPLVFKKKDDGPGIA